MRETKSVSLQILHEECDREANYLFLSVRIFQAFFACGSRFTLMSFQRNKCNLVYVTKIRTKIDFIFQFSMALA